ncbi:MAG: SRPBCC family protein [Actinobacteria bacterium]|nr:SRPBCC family protein [Actinomycetota bacterium]
MESLRHRESIEINAPPETVYDLVTDVSRTGQWSPVCKESWYKDGGGPRVGAVIVGKNVTPQREWQTESEVVAADRPRAFAWVVNGNVARWGYELEPLDDGARTRLTESWEVLPSGVEFFSHKYGDDAGAQLDERRRAALEGIPATLAAIKRVVEAE